MEGSLRQDGPECVGRLTMTVETAKPSPEAAERWARRGEVLAAWLLGEWLRERQETRSE